MRNQRKVKNWNSRIYELLVIFSNKKSCCLLSTKKPPVRNHLLLCDDTNRYQPDESMMIRKKDKCFQVFHLDIIYINHISSNCQPLYLLFNSVQIRVGPYGPNKKDSRFVVLTFLKYSQGPFKPIQKVRVAQL